MAKDTDKKTKRAVSALSPVNRQGVKGVTLSQELGLGFAVHEKTSAGQGSAAGWIKAGDWGKAGKAYMHAMDPRNTTSAKVFWGATVLKIGLSVLRPGKPPLRAGILQVV